MPQQLIDVAFAAKVAARFASQGPLDQSYLLDDLDADLSRLVAEAEPLIEAETGFVTGSPAVANVLSRSEWAAANVDSMLVLMAPLLEKVDAKVSSSPIGSVVKLAYRPALGAQMGTVLGFLSQRVLGQYDLLLGRHDHVWFVGPNMVLMERRFGFVPRDFRLWVVLHELTHRAQFEGNPWVRQYFIDSVSDLLSSLDMDAGTLLDRLIQALKSGEGSQPFGLRMLSEEQRAKFNDMQAFMSVIEGHGNFIMDSIAERIIPTQPRMRRVLRGGASSSGVMAKLIGKLLGLEMKRAQYEDGQRFFDKLLASAGQEAVNKVFTSAEYLPSLDEVKRPELWVKRAL
ncbi:MAG: zinc-dependent metalloprotease [Actinomycetota bacterium]|nr:zinc-dependent metalloprotease [Actinomycetota bacterium]